MKVDNDLGLPATPGAVPDYRPILKATDAFVGAYKKRLLALRRDRARKLSAICARPDAAAFAAYAAEVRRALLKALGGFQARHANPPPLLVRTGLVTVDGATLAVRRRLLSGAASRGGDLAFLEIRHLRAAPQPLLLLLGDACGQVHGGDSPESVATRWGYRFAAAGYAVVVPDPPALRDASATRNKALLLEGSCTLGELVDDTERVFDAALRLEKFDRRRVWAGGSGLGGLAALTLAALDRRVAGCLSADAPRRGDLDSVEALTVPDIHNLTDMAELAAASAPAPLALLRAGAAPWGDVPPSLEWAAASARLARRAAPAGFLGISSSGYSDQAIHKLIAWMNRQELPAASDHRPARLPRRPAREERIGIAAMPTLRAWQSKRVALRRAFFQALGQPERHRPLRICHIARDELADCTREEIDVWSSDHTAAKVLFLRPRGAAGRIPTVLCLPGSSSHAGRVEEAYAHEVVARGWNAVVVDCRARIYRHYPGLRDGRVLIGHSVYDQLCVMDYLVTRGDVDPKRIGAMGLSQGGIHSWMLAALDERVAVCVPVCGLASYRSTIEEVRDERYDATFMSFLDSHSYYYFLPGILRRAEQADLIGLIAPRPLAILGATHDHCFPLRGIREIHADLKHLYGLYGARERLSIYLFNGRHSMPPLLRRKAYRFFGQHL